MLSLTSSELMGRILSFFAVAYVARKLGPAGMGTLAFGTAILAYGSIFADAGLPILGTRSAAAGDEDLNSLVKRILSPRLFLSVATIVAGSAVLFVGIKDSTTRNVAIIYLLTLIPSAVILDWLFQGLKSITTLAMGRILGMVAYLLFVIFLVSEKGDIVFVPVAWVAGAIAQALFLWTAYRRLNRARGQTLTSPRGLWGTIQQGVPLGIATLISQVVIQFPFIYMALFSSARITGIYSVAFRVIVLMLIVDRVFYTLFFPAISESFKEGMVSLARKFDRTLKFVSAGALGVGILAILASRSIFPAIFGSEFTDSSAVFQFLVVYFILTVINSTFTFTLIGAEKEIVYTRSLAVGGVGFFAIMFLPVPVPLTLLAPLALTVFQTFSFMVMSRALQTIIPLSLFRRIFVPILTAIGLLLLFTPWEREGPLPTLVVALIVSFPLLAFASGVKREDLHELRRLFV